jgi:heterotetrameric sarcosine oxidase gamma subunit
MVDRSSPLAGLTAPRMDGLLGEAGPGVTLSTRTDLSLWQVAAWPESAAAVAARLQGEAGAVVRLGPLKWWVIDGGRPAFAVEEAVTLDLSHEQTPIRVAGRDAEALMARVVALDLRESAFPVGAFAATGGHHLMLKVRRTAPDAFEVFVMRSFARHLWETLESHAVQFGLAVA